MWSMLITGTKSGIGLELVKLWLQKAPCPDILIATVRKISDAPELTSLAASFPNLRILELDLTQYNTFDDFARRVGDIVGEHGLNVLHHNAGVLFSEDTLGEVTERNLSRHFNVNTIGPILLTKALLPLLKKGAKNSGNPNVSIYRGAIIYTSSQLGSLTNNTIGKIWGYRESKCAGNMALVTLKAELAADGIGTLMLHPGWVQTKVGGPDAILTPLQSASGLLTVMLGLNDQTNGKFITYANELLPW